MNLITKLTATALLLGSFSQVVAGNLFMSQTESVKVDGKDVKVFLGTPFTVIKDGDKEATVSLEGFLVDDKLFFSKGKSLQIAEVPKGTKVEKLDGEKVKLIATVSKDNLSDDVKDIWAEQEEFYFETCTQCHAAHKTEEHSMNEWASIFGTMRGFAQLDDDEATPLLRFLKANGNNGLYASKKEDLKKEVKEKIKEKVDKK